MSTFEANLSDLQPSQLYICSEKLAEEERSMRTEQGLSVDPLPVKRLGPRTVLTDGHGIHPAWLDSKSLGSPSPETNRVIKGVTNESLPVPSGTKKIQGITKGLHGVSDGDDNRVRTKLL